MSEHTPTPWRHGISSAGFFPIHADQGPLTVCPCAAHSLPDAEMIVRAVNCHDELVSAIGEYLALFDRMAAGNEVSPIELANARCSMRDAKRKAEGRS